MGKKGQKITNQENYIEDIEAEWLSEKIKNK